MNIGQLPNGEAVHTRIEELNTFIQNFPDSKLTPIFKKEIEHLETIRKDFSL